MSGGTPTAGGGYMRQRYSQGYLSSGEDLEDDAISRIYQVEPPITRARTWTEGMEIFLWLASAAFIVYFGDRRSNLISVLWRDDRIRRTPLYLGFVGILLNVGLISYTTLFTWWGMRRVDDKFEALPPSTAPLVSIIGVISFCLLSFALWPIWSFLTLPLLFTLFMAFMVILPYLPIGTFRAQAGLFRVD